MSIKNDLREKDISKLESKTFLDNYKVEMKLELDEYRKHYETKIESYRSQMQQLEHELMDECEYLRQERELRSLEQKV